MLVSRKEDIYIGVMGVTGAGKSSFISQCCPDATGIIGEDMDSCRCSPACSKSSEGAMEVDESIKSPRSVTYIP